MKKLILGIFILCGFLQAGSLNEYVLHNPPQPALQGEKIRLELTHINSQFSLYDPVIFFRQRGEEEFNSIRMKNDGYLLYGDIPTENMHPGHVEYYFAFLDGNGQPLYLPESSPETNPLVMQIYPGEELNEQYSANETEILLLSPDPGEIMPADEFLIALSVPLDLDDLDAHKFRLLIGGVDVSRLLEREENLITFTPKNIRRGYHNAEFKVYSPDGRLLGEKHWSFHISSAPAQSKGFNSRTSIYLDNRYQDISQSSRNLFRGGLDFSGSYKKLDFIARLLISSEETASQQPINYYGAQLRYNLSPYSSIYLKGGDFSNDYDILSFWGKRVRGISGGLNMRYFGLDISYGKSRVAVEGTAVDTSQVGDPPTITQYGTYQHNFLAIRPEFHFGSHVDWGLNLVNGKDDKTSIKYGGNPKESLTIGTTLRLNFDRNHITFLGSFQASMKNENANGTVDFDTLAERYNLTGSEKELAESIYNFFESTNLLTVSEGLAPIPSLAMRFETNLRYFNHNFRVTYKNIEADYVTAGNPYLLKDISGIFIRDNIRMFNNQVFLNLFFKSYNDNISQNEAKTKNTDIGGSLSYFPFQSLPSITLSYNTHSRLNDLAGQNIDPDSTRGILIEDNKTQQIGFTTSYNFDMGKLRNTVTLNISSFKRDDAYYASNQSDFTVYSVGLRSRFGIPLTTRLSYAQTGSSFGADTSQSTTDIQKIFLHMDYLFKGAAFNGDLRPFIIVNFQKINNSVSSIGEYNRINYTAGLYLRNTNIGNFSLRYDYIDFGNLVSWKDSIMSARYELTF